MELLTTKIIALTIMGALTLFFGLIPLKIRKHLMKGTKKRERITSYCLCLGGGVLLATVFIHMIPETREGFESALANGYITAGEGYPLAELVICAGFFLIYCVEEFVHKFTRVTGADERRDSSHHHRHHHHHHHHRRHGHHHNAHKMENMECGKSKRDSGRCSVYSITEAVKKASVGGPPETFTPRSKWAESGVDNPVFSGDVDATSWNPALKDSIVTSSQVAPTNTQDTSTESADIPANDELINNNNGVNVDKQTSGNNYHSHSNYHTHESGHHSHAADIGKLFSKGFGSNLRSVIIVLALSIHSIFEGLAVGLQERVVDVWYLFGAIAAHKLVIAFCLGFKLLTSMSIGLMVIYMVVFALVSPLGIAIGILVTESIGNDPASHVVTVTVLQGLAGGTILYVTFFEILERERSKDGGKLLKFFFVLLGFAAMASMEAFGGHSHGPSGEHGGHGHSHGGHGHSHGGHGHSSHEAHDHGSHDELLATTPFGEMMIDTHSQHNHNDHATPPLEEAHFTRDFEKKINMMDADSHGSHNHEHDDGHNHAHNDHTEDGHDHAEHDHTESGHNHAEHDHTESGHNHAQHDHIEAGHNHEELVNDHIQGHDHAKDNHIHENDQHDHGQSHDHVTHNHDIHDNDHQSDMNDHTLDNVQPSSASTGIKIVDTLSPHNHDDHHEHEHDNHHDPTASVTPSDSISPLVPGEMDHANHNHDVLEEIPSENDHADHNNGVLEGIPSETDHADHNHGVLEGTVSENDHAEHNHDVLEGIPSENDHTDHDHNVVLTTPGTDSIGDTLSELSHSDPDHDHANHDH